MNTLFLCSTFVLFVLAVLRVEASSGLEVMAEQHLHDAGLHYKVKDYHMATTCYEDASRVYRAIGSNIEAAVASNNAAQTYLEHGHAVSASWVYGYVARSYKAAKDYKSAAAAYENAAIAMLASGDSIAASWAYTAALKASEMGSDMPTQIRLQNQIDLIVRKEGGYEAILGACHYASYIFNTTRNYTVGAWAFEKTAKAHDEDGRYTIAAWLYGYAARMHKLGNDFNLAGAAYERGAESLMAANSSIAASWVWFAAAKGREFAKNHTASALAYEKIAAQFEKKEEFAAVARAYEDAAKQHLAAGDNSNAVAANVNAADAYRMHGQATSHKLALETANGIKS